jgi:nucleoside phosphorylase
MVLLTFALPVESGHFLRGLPFTQRVSFPAPFAHLPLLRAEYQGVETFVAHTGIGCEAAAETVSVLLELYRPCLLISSGFAGGLDRSLQIADVVVATNYSAPEVVANLRRIPCFEEAGKNDVNPQNAPASTRPRLFFGPLITTDQAMESVDEKLRLEHETHALAVDMETAAIAKVCAQADTPLLSLRAISDSAQDALPVPFRSWFDLRRQRPRPLGLCWHLLSHPSAIIPFRRFVHRLPYSRRALTHILRQVLLMRTRL